MKTLLPHISCHNSPMRHLLTSGLLLVILFPSLALGESMDDLVKRDGLYYKKFTHVPFTGKTTGRKQVSFKNGKKHGLWVVYYRDGQLSEKGTYKNGKKDGLWVDYSWDNGQLGSKGQYIDGKRDGLWETYHDNGQLQTKGYYKDGKKDGLWEYFHENGQLFSKGHLKDGKRDGLWEYFNEDGTVWERITGTYKNGEKIK